MAERNNPESGRRLLRGLLENEQVLCALSGAIQGTTQNQPRRLAPVAVAVGSTSPQSSASAEAAASTTTSAASNNSDGQTSVRSEVARLFGRNRETSSSLFHVRNNLTGKRQKASTKAGKKTKAPSGTFTNDVVLLARPEEDIVPRHGEKHYLAVNGHVLYGCSFCKEWDTQQVMVKLRSLFPKQLKDNVKIEILTSISNKLLAPTLAPGQELDGFVMRKMFGTKTVYIRPSMEVLAPEWLVLQWDEEEAKEANEPKRKKKSPPINIFDDDDDFELLPSAAYREDKLSTSDPVKAGTSTLHENAPSTSLTSNSMEDHDMFLLREYAALFHAETCTEDGGHDDEGSLSDEIEVLGDCTDEIEVVGGAPPASSVVSLHTLLEEMSESVDRENISKFNICRTRVWEGVVRAMQRKSFSPGNKMSVKFTDDFGQSEGAVDLGGPRRELLTLVLLELQQSRLFTSSPNNIGKLLENFGPALQNDHYFYAGQIMAMSLVHGGPAPRFLSPVLFDALVFGPDKVEVSAQDIPDCEVRTSLEKLREATSLEKINDAVGDMSTLLSFAGTMLHVTREGDQHAMVRQTARWYVLGRTRCAFDRFRDGLCTLGILDAMRKHPSSFRGIFCLTSVELTADGFACLFHVERDAESGSNKWKRESEVLAFWMDYLQDAEERVSAADLPQILSFITGCTSVPPLGFHPKPEVHFLHDSHDLFPKANTCSCVLHLPVKHNDYEKFKADIDFAILNSGGFGLA